MTNEHPLPLRTLVAEVLGTFLMVFLGLGSVHTAVLTGAQSGVWQVAIVWGLGVMLAIFAVGSVSGAHLNPAITIAVVIWRRFPWQHAIGYILSQVAGAALAAAVLYVLWSPWLAEREHIKGVTRGQPTSIITAMCYGEYFPNPGGLAAGPYQIDPTEYQAYKDRVSEPLAAVAELIATLILALVIFAVTDDRNGCAPPPRLAPAFIGLTVAALISVFAPLTQACFNPARDFGPRLFAYFAGWGAAAIPGPTPTGFLTVYIVAPIVGAVIGGGIYTYILRPGLRCDVIEGKSEPV